jgi:hypothetical protein
VKPSNRHNPETEKHAMKMLTKVAKSCCTTEKTAQCCAKSSRLVTGCHD